MSTTGTLQGIRILVVDNDLDNSEMLQICLMSEGANVSIACDARQAREMMRAFAPEVLVSDLALPDEDGYALMASIRADPATSKLPAIAVTGFSDANSLRRAMEAGFDQRLVKPVHLPDLVAAIQALISHELVST